MKKNLIFLSLFNAIGVTVYIFLVSLVMQNAEKIFGKMENYLGPIAFLLLFVLSAAVTGFLIIGRPIIFYIDGKKIEAVSLFLYTIGFLFVIMILVLVSQIIS